MSVLLHIQFDIDPSAVDPKDGKSVENLFPIEGAKKLNQLPGLQWKIWASDDTNHGSGFYLYATRRDAEIRAKLAVPHLNSLPGISNTTTTIYEILEPHSTITRAPLTGEANPSYPEGFEDTVEE